MVPLDAALLSSCSQNEHQFFITICYIVQSFKFKSVVVPDISLDDKSIFQKPSIAKRLKSIVKKTYM